MKINKKRIHLIGIKGVGMTPISILLKEAGHYVQGSDVQEQYITDSMLKSSGIKVFTSFSEKNLDKIDLVITTGAHKGLNNIEAIAARSRGIPIWTQGEAVGKLMKGVFLGEKKYQGVSVSGTHGKTTSTAMLASSFSSLKLDPTYLIGTSSFNVNNKPGRFGKGNYFIAEADEYVNLPGSDNTPKFNFQEPNYLVITNISYDHPDVYENLDSVYDAFNIWLKNIEKCNVIINSDKIDEQKLVIDNKKHNVVRFGHSKLNDFIITRSFVSSSQTFFWLKKDNLDLGEFRINLPGIHNVLNTMPSIIIQFEIGVKLKDIKASIQNYKGSKRRLEFIGISKKNKLNIYDDYAHHPDEIDATIETFRSMYPNNKIIVIFQPHTFTRTKKLLVQFSNSLSKADFIIVDKIFGSAREEASNIKSSDLVELTKKHNQNAFLLNEGISVDELVQKADLNEGDCVITMGAGDIYKLNKELIKL